MNDPYIVTDFGKLLLTFPERILDFIELETELVVTSVIIADDTRSSTCSSGKE
jgi:hypothetical protein